MQDPKRSESRGTPFQPVPVVRCQGPCDVYKHRSLYMYIGNRRGGRPIKILNSADLLLPRSAASTFVTLFLLRPRYLACCPNVIAGRRDSLFHARALPLMLTHVHRPPFCFVQPGVLGIGSTVRPYDLRTLLAAGVCAARRAPSTHAMFGGSTCPAP